ncbi:MAG: cysteine hydrolase [Acidimicrobiales bacterium]
MPEAGRIISVETSSGPVEMNLARTAVIVVDMQNDFGSPGGMFDLSGIDTTQIRAVVPTVAEVLTAARRVGIRVIYLKMGFEPDLSDAGIPDAPVWRVHKGRHVGETVTAPDGSSSRVLIHDTWNTEILDELRPEPGDIVIKKNRYSGFYGTELHETLQRLGITDLIVTGCTTSVCVESTIRDASFRDYRCVLLSDCTAEPIGHDLARSNHDASVLLIELMLGRVTSSSVVVAALR